MDSTADDRDDDIGDRQAYDLYGWESPSRQGPHTIGDPTHAPDSPPSDHLPRQSPSHSWESVVGGSFPGFTPVSHRQRTPSPSEPGRPAEPSLNQPPPALAPPWRTIIPVVPGQSPQFSGPQSSPQSTQWRAYPTPGHNAASPRDEPTRDQALRGDVSRDEALRGDVSRDEALRGDVSHDEAMRDDAPSDDAARDQRQAWASARPGGSPRRVGPSEDELLERPAGFTRRPGRTEPASDHDGDRSRRDRRSMPLWQELPLLLVIAFCMAVLIRTFLVQAFYIPSGSMEETLLVGDRVLVNKIVYDVRQPERGEVVVFRGTDNWAPENFDEPSGGLSARVGRTLGDLVGVSRPGEKDFIKRVIGLPGDRVSCCDPSGRVYVNGKGLDEPYVLDNSPEDVPPDPQVCRSRQFTEVLVPPGQLFVMGDHRIVSQDSRCQGTVPIENVIGRAFVIVWPSGRWDTLTVPETFASVPQPVAEGGLVGETLPAATFPAVGAAVITMPILASLVLTARRGLKPRWGRSTLRR